LRDHRGRIDTGGMDHPKKFCDLTGPQAGRGHVESEIAAVPGGYSARSSAQSVA
jgi:hypothetical protein